MYNCTRRTRLILDPLDSCIRQLHDVATVGTSAVATSAAGMATAAGGRPRKGGGRQALQLRLSSARCSLRAGFTLRAGGCTLQTVVYRAWRLVRGGCSRPLNRVAPPRGGWRIPYRSSSSSLTELFKPRFQTATTAGDVPSGFRL